MDNINLMFNELYKALEDANYRQIAFPLDALHHDYENAKDARREAYRISSPPIGPEPEPRPFITGGGGFRS